MTPSKKFVLIGTSVGAGFGLMLFLIVGGIYWYKSRPKTWNINAVKASFDEIDTEEKMPAEPLAIGKGLTSEELFWQKIDEIVRKYGGKVVEKPTTDNHLVFHYTLENTTRQDYRIQDNSSIELMAKRQGESLSAGRESIEIQTPVFIPAKQRVSVSVHLTGPY